MDGYSSKIRKVSRCRPTVWNETILATRLEVFFIKLVPVQSISKLWVSQIWTLMNNLVIVLAWEKCLKLITLEENVVSVRQLPLCFPLFFWFSPEVLNSGIKSRFDGCQNGCLSVKMQFVKNILVYFFGVFSFCYCFCEGFTRSKPLNLALESSVIHVSCPY